MYGPDSYDDLSGDVGGVETSVAGVIAAFENGAAILARMKARRAANQELPFPRILEESISEAPAEIKREQIRGIVRYGSQFEVGDVTAVLALKNITIQLQNSLLNKLGDVEDGDADVTALARAADTGRDNTITTLINLRRRIADAELMTRTVSATSTMSLGSATPLSSIDSTTMSPPQSRPPPPVSHFRSQSESSLSGYPPPVPPKNYDHMPSYQNTSFNPGMGMPAIPQEWGPPYNGDDSPIAYRSSVPGREYMMRSPSIYSPVPRPSSFSSPPGTASPKPTLRTMSEGSTPSVKDYPLNFTARNQHPTRENNYLGFCKSSWRLQCGDTKAMTKAKDFSQSAQSKYHYLVCSKRGCDFKGRGTDVLTNKVITDDRRGIKYRWTFLAKSHVGVKTTHEEQFSYLCMFCVFGGHAPMVMNLTALLDHVSQQHRGGTLSEVIVDRTSCVQDRVCKDIERFDINLLPTEDGSRRGSNVPRDSGVYRPFEDKAFSEAPVELSGRKRSEVGERLFELYSAS